VSLFDLAGKVAVITGATKGIGLGIANQMAAHGARIIVSSRTQADCEKIAADIGTTYGRGAAIAKGIACDLDKLQDIQDFAKQAAQAFGAIDILVCNAAVLAFIGPSSETPPAQFDRILTRNTHHNFRLCQALRAEMVKRGGGCIILIGSIAGHTALSATMAYSIAKAGVAHMARCLADEMASDRIRVNCVSPGFIRSFSSQRIVDNPSALSLIVRGTPLGRIGEPEDIAGAVIYLASAAGSFVTGATILVDGGRALLSPPDPRRGLIGIEPGTSHN
jgi:NAD(P)-dependent dehydrogenase (short-subunit alcohol dehydrogenase family)